MACCGNRASAISVTRFRVIDVHASGTVWTYSGTANGIKMRGAKSPRIELRALGWGISLSWIDFGLPSAQCFRSRRSRACCSCRSTTMCFDYSQDNGCNLTRRGVGRKIFGINMRSMRLTRGMSQERLAEACNLHRTYIGSVERGERNISIDNMERIAAGLDVTVLDLLQKNHNVPRNPQAARSPPGNSLSEAYPTYRSR